jgi:nucleotide-binding universal stress UspA family protein
MTENTQSEQEQPVVAGFDGSADAEVALSWAVDYARTADRALRVVVAWIDTTDVVQLTTTTPEERRKPVLERAAQLVADLPDDRVRVDTDDRAAAPALIDASEGAHALVMGAQGHGAVYGLLIGSVSQHVARHAHCPVVVVRRPRDRESDRVVVGVDGSEWGRHALRFAFEHVALFGGQLTVLAVSSYASMIEGSALFGYGRPYPADYRTEIREWLDGEMRELRAEHPSVETSVELAVGSPGRLLADASRAAAMVVVGSRGRGEFAGLLLGSTSSAVLHHAQCPVAVVR